MCFVHTFNVKSILIVEDDDSILDVLRIILNNAGYKTILYSDGRGVISGQFESPDLFLLDKQLSGLDGLDICKHLKENPRTKDIPIIMVSANPQIATLSIEAGANDYIEKPFTIELLLRKVRKQINHHSYTS
jgi:DNA-binding response OmpR family regulator